MHSNKIFDTHCHLTDPKFAGEREEIIEGLYEHEVQGFTEIGFDVPSSEAAVALAEHYEALRQDAEKAMEAGAQEAGISSRIPEVYAAVGIHPDHADCLNADACEALRKLALSKRVVAIGEIGLDYHYTREGIIKRAEKQGQEPDPEALKTADPDPEIQKQTFRTMLQMARELRLPINIHSRDAAKDTYDILVEEKGYEQSGIVHCFGYSYEMAKQFVKLGMMIGIGGVVTFKNARKLVEVAEKLPIEHIVLETDSPYMAPAPYRGVRNDPGMLPYVAAKIAELKGMKVEDVVRITTENAIRVYRLL